MTWTRIEDDFNDSPRLLTISRDARLALIEFKVYANKHLTDGFIPTAALRRVTDSPDPEAAIAELMKAELCAVVDGGWQIDWTGQETAKVVRSRTEANRKKQENYRLRGVLHGQGDHTRCDPRYCKHAGTKTTGHQTSNVTGNDPSLATPTRTDPARPEGKGPVSVGTDGSAPKGADHRPATDRPRYRKTGKDEWVVEMPHAVARR